MKRYRITDPAKRDIRQIVSYLRERSPQGARAVRMDIDAAISRLVKMPGAGHKRDDLIENDLRFLPVRSYLVVYRQEAKRIMIVRVLHGGRDVEKILRGGK